MTLSRPFFPNQSHEVRAAATETLSVLGFLFAADDIAFLRFFHTLLCRLTLEVDDAAGADSGAMLSDTIRQSRHTAAVLFQYSFVSEDQRFFTASSKNTREI